ncbi:MAG: FKBP-type peptidyl-prolyl cis-trans isomerase [Desulfomonilia bacterium]|nr:FKBP-type peptidyl-prolyl cis-trans isomerase [Desulfomonilia bacterium]
MIRAAKLFDTVKVNYTGRSEDGSVFESSVGIVPLRFTIGTNEVVKGFENAVIGMCPGEKKTVVVKPEDGFGLYDEDLVFEISRDDVPDDMEPSIGMDFEMVDEDGNVIDGLVVEIMDDSIVIDANALLAGKNVIYDIELIEILSPGGHGPARSQGDG